MAYATRVQRSISADIQANTMMLRLVRVSTIITWVMQSGVVHDRLKNIDKQFDKVSWSDEPQSSERLIVLYYPLSSDCQISLYF